MSIKKQVVLLITYKILYHLRSYLFSTVQYSMEDSHTVHKKYQTIILICIPEQGLSILYDPKQEYISKQVHILGMKVLIFPDLYTTNDDLQKNSTEKAPESNVSSL